MNILNLETGKYVERGIKTDYAPQVFENQDSAKPIVTSEPLLSGLGDALNVYFVSNPANKIGAVRLLEISANKLLDQYMAAHPEVKQRIEKEAHEAMSRHDDLLGELLGGLLPQLGHHLPGGIMPKEMYEKKCQACDDKDKCRGYKQAEAYYSKGKDLTEEAAAGLAALFG